jgi:hypothetical protein
LIRFACYAKMFIRVIFLGQKTSNRVFVNIRKKKIFPCLCPTRIRVGVRHQHDTYGYTKLCYFFKLLSVSPCQCLCRVWCLVSVSVSMLHRLKIYKECKAQLNWKFSTEDTGIRKLQFNITPLSIVLV